MLSGLNEQQKLWVTQTLASMSLDECLAQLLCPDDRGYDPQYWAELVQAIPVGSVFLAPNDAEHYQECVRAIQENSRLPVLIASDLEHGVGSMVREATEFPWQMACGATDDPGLMEKLGKAMAMEARSYGIHWSFSPVVDLNINHRNSVINIRAFGDRAEHVSRMATQMIRGMQADGRLAACAKHFPGDGTDDRDGHLCTTCNLMSYEDWSESFGLVWRDVIDSGVMSIMSGQISFPLFEGFAYGDPAAMPATLSKKLQVDLLRNELGFEGVIVSDAGPMIGMASRISADRLAVENILTGSDVYLFARAKQDFEYLKKAVAQGEIPEERIRKSARRILEMKARVGLHGETLEESVIPEELAYFRRLSQEAADKSVTICRADKNLPVKLKPGDKVLTVALHYTDAREHLSSELSEVDAELRKRGMIVDHLVNPSHRELIGNAGNYKRVFFNIVVMPHSLPGTINIIGKLVLPFWRAFWVDCPNVVFTSFGSPYHLYEMPHLPNMVLAYGAAKSSQRAAVKVWLGEIPAIGKCPVSLNPYVFENVRVEGDTSKLSHLFE